MPTINQLVRKEPQKEAQVQQITGAEPVPAKAGSLLAGSDDDTQET